MLRKMLLFGIAMLILVKPAVEAQSLEDQAREKIDSLESLISIAEAAGIDVLKEEMTIRTAEIFLGYASWDESHLAENTAYFELVNIYSDNAARMAADLADFERNDLGLMLDEAIANLTRLINGEIYRKPSPHVNWAEVTHDKEQLTFNNRPVFLADYTWKPEIDQLTDYHGDLDGFFLTPGHVNDDAGNIKSWIVSDLNAKPDGSLGFIFMNHKNPPQWAMDKYGPGFDLGVGLRYTEYDIDNPGAREMQQLLLAGTVPLMAGKKYSQLGYMLCNEPHFYTSIDGTKELWASGGVSSYTFEKFHTWLSEKHDSIAALNALWGTDFSNFDSVLIQIPIDLALRGTPKWYDWATFNNHRVTDWYTFMRDEIRKHDTVAKVHLKIMPNLWSENHRNHGIDFEALSEMSDILGNDAGSENSRMWGEMPWAEHYALKWRELFMSYDFLKSLGPDKLIFNSESHFLSTGKFRDLYQDPAYVRCLFWAAHILGLDASQIWYWPRLEDGSIKSNAGKGYAGSNSQQPRVTNEVHSTLMDLNAFAEEIMAMQRLKKPIRIFYSETSAINKVEHMDDVFELYEALSFEGIPLGFATRNIITKQDNKLWETILVHKTEFVTQAEMEALQAYLDQGGTVVMDNVSLKKNEYGQELAGLEPGTGTLLSAASLAEMKSKALDLMAAKDLMPGLSITETNTGGSKACWWRILKNKEGNHILSLVNLGKTDASLKIELAGAENGIACKDLMTGVPVSPDPVLKPYEVYFVEVAEDTAGTQVGREAYDVLNAGKLYPNPSGGEFFITFPETLSNLELRVYNMVGETVLWENYEGVRTITANLGDYPSGLYAVRAISEHHFHSFIYIKQ